MKKLFLIISLLFFLISFSQNIIIEVYETQPFYGDTSQKIDEIFDSNLYDKILPAGCKYFINTTQNYLDFYRNDTLKMTYPIKTSKNQNFIQIDILVKGFNVGLILNLNPFNEIAAYFNIQESYVIYNKFIKYKIIKEQ
jgi:hypothetical protein